MPFTRQPALDPAKVSAQHPQNYKESLLAYGANTHNGLVRQYNEDRISIVLDLKSRRQIQTGIPERRV